MRSQDSEQQILDAIETQLRSEDPRLAACFIAFTSVTRNAGMPPAEQLSEGRWVASRRSHRRRGWPSYALLIQLVMLFFAGMTMFFMVPAAINRMPWNWARPPACRQVRGHGGPHP
jgi:hypothetical protein